MRVAKSEQITDRDQAEIDRFAIFLRRLGQAEAAGLTRGEAARAIYPDSYPEDAEHDLYPTGSILP